MLNDEEKTYLSRLIGYDLLDLDNEEDKEHIKMGLKLQKKLISRKATHRA